MNVISEGLSSTVSPKENCSTDAVVAKGSERGPARYTHKSKELRPHSVPSGNNLFHSDAYEKLINGELNLGCRSIPEASEDYKMIPNEDRAVSGPLDVRGCESTPKALLRRRAERKITNGKASIQAIVPTGTSASPDVKHPKMVSFELCISKNEIIFLHSQIVQQIPLPLSLALMKTDRSNRTDNKYTFYLLVQSSRSYK